MVLVSRLQSYMPHGQELMELANDRMWESRDSRVRQGSGMSQKSVTLGCLTWPVGRFFWKLL
jgi:hypothetical protein